MQFMTGENSFPVPYRLVEVSDGQGKYPSDLGSWAEPDVEYAAGILQELEKRPDRARAIAVEAQRSTEIMLSAERFCSGLLQPVD
jgi:hypothetical protein